MTKKKKPSFNDAVRELEEILEGIEGEDVDIDDLSDKVERGADLIRLCREKIQSTEARVTKVVRELEASAQEDEEEKPAKDAPAPPPRDETSSDSHGEQVDDLPF